jgi:phosphatidylethanolamine-binding protein (PEBP) family uncharacterized protein
MLQYFPKAIGHALYGIRAGTEKLLVNSAEVAAPDCITVDSAAFGDGAGIPLRYAADGEGLSPPLRWRGTPPTTACVALLIEDADSPTPKPLVHALASLLPHDGEILEGDLPNPARPGRIRLGRNSYFKHSYLPPDPPPGHGPHRYAFQIFALRQAPPNSESMGRSALAAWLRGRVIGKGFLIGTYERR